MKKYKTTKFKDMLSDNANSINRELIELLKSNNINVKWDEYDNVQSIFMDPKIMVQLRKANLRGEEILKAYSRALNIGVDKIKERMLNEMLDEDDELVLKYKPFSDKDVELSENIYEIMDNKPKVLLGAVQAVISENAYGKKIGDKDYSIPQILRMMHDITKLYDRVNELLNNDFKELAKEYDTSVEKIISMFYSTGLRNIVEDNEMRFDTKYGKKENNSVNKENNKEIPQEFLDALKYIKKQ